jgi:hypothetical protein
MTRLRVLLFRAAQRSLGGVTQTKEVYRQLRSSTWLEDLARGPDRGIAGDVILEGKLPEAVGRFSPGGPGG